MKLKEREQSPVIATGLAADGGVEIASALRELPAELRADNLELTRFLRSTHQVCDNHNDVATASLIEVWIDHAERRTWFLSEIERGL